MTRKRKLKGLTPARRQRMSKVEELLLKGISGQKIADRLGVSESVVYADIKLIRRQWARKDLRRRTDRRRYAVKKLERFQQAAWDSYERSKESISEVTYSKKPEKCEHCKKGLLKDGSWCTVCEGTGTVYIDVEVHKVKGREGDTIHLRLALEAQKEIDKLEDTYPSKKVELKGEVGVSGVIGMIRGNLEKAGEYSMVPATTLLNALSALADLKEAAKTTNIVEAESRAIEDKGSNP